MAEQLSDRNRCMFIHIPKTGGSSIEQSAIFRDVRNANGAPPGGHVSALEFRKRHPLKFETYYKFSMVRNPYDRLVSAYFWLARGGSGNNQDTRIFETWFKNGPGNFQDFCLNLINRDIILTIPHLKPQHSFICDPDMNIIVDFIGRQECHEKDSRVIFKKLRLPFEYRYSSPTWHKHFSAYYTETIRERVHHLYTKDFELLGYAPEIPHGITALHYFHQAWSFLKHARYSLGRPFLPTGKN